jgi:hypothetical protein
MYTAIFEDENSYKRQARYFEDKLQKPNPCIGCAVQAMQPPCYSARYVDEVFDIIFLITLITPCPPALEWFKEASHRELTRIKRNYGANSDEANFWKHLFDYFHGYWEEGAVAEDIIDLLKLRIQERLFYDTFKADMGNAEQF